MFHRDVFVKINIDLIDQIDLLVEEMISKSKKFTQVIQSDIELHRKPVFFLEKTVGSDLDFVGIFAAGFRRKRSDRFSWNPAIGYCRNRPNLMLGKSRIMPDSTTNLARFCRNLEITGIHRLSILKLKVYYTSKLNLLLL